MAYNCKILADSVNPQGDRLTTMKITFPRFILAEAKTHRIISGLGEQVEVTKSLGFNDEFDFSRNSASSRAIPFKKMVKMVEENPFIPIAWQKDHKGMQGSEYFTDKDNIWFAKANWLKARDKAIEQAKILNGLGVTKQLCNRLLEPFMWHTVIVTATEWENFFNLRCPQYEYKLGAKKYYFKSWKDLIIFIESTTNNKDYINSWKNETILNKLKINQSQADIHIQAIAELMWDAYNESKPKKLQAGEWHIPFGDNFNEEELHKLSSYTSDYGGVHSSEFEDYLKEQEIIKVKIATARCARISYETLGDNPKIDYEADIRLHDMLAESGHWSPFEHVAKAMSDEEYSRNVQGSHSGDFDFGVYGEGWCRNFRGFIQYRSLVDEKS